MVRPKVRQNLSCDTLVTSLLGQGSRNPVFITTLKSFEFNYPRREMNLEDYALSISYFAFLI